ATRTYDANDLLECAPPRRDQMEHPARETGSERPLVEREPHGVPEDEREPYGAGLLDEDAEHRFRKIEPDDRDAGICERERHLPGAHPDLQPSPATTELIREQRRLLADRVVRQPSRLVVVRGGPIERA